MKKKNITTILIILAIYIGVFLLTDVTGIIGPYYQVNIFLAGINIILALSLNLIVGFTGQLALGHAGFMAVGAYVSAVCTMKLGIPFIPAVVVGALAAMLIGLVIGLPTLRLRGDYLAIATLGFGEIIRGLVVNIEYVGGAAGINGIPKKTTWTMLFLFVIITIAVIKNFINSSHGKMCVSIRDNEVAAEIMGVNTTYYKTVAFSLGAFFAGLGGALYAHYFFLIQPTTFTFARSFDILVMVVLGGLGSITGSILAAIGVTFLNAVLVDFGAIRMVIYALLLILVMIFRPQGLMGTKEFNLQSLLGFKGRGGKNAKNN
ncbi:MAG: branched-chain amino acid ABC transporter permease [Clostridia bacterium]